MAFASIRLNTGTLLLDKLLPGFKQAGSHPNQPFLVMRNVSSNSGHNSIVLLSAMVYYIVGKGTHLVYLYTRPSSPTPSYRKSSPLCIRLRLHLILVHRTRLHISRSYVTGMACARTLQTFVLIVHPASPTKIPHSLHQHFPNHVPSSPTLPPCPHPLPYHHPHRHHRPHPQPLWSLRSPSPLSLVDKSVLSSRTYYHQPNQTPPTTSHPVPHLAICTTLHQIPSPSSIQTVNCMVSILHIHLH